MDAINHADKWHIYNVGTPKMGVPDRYHLCWGRNPSLGDVENSWYQLHYLTVGY